ncbi:hypothetical protein PHAGE_JEFFCO_19 [Acinetobacter phage JeffCo]|nr:hypothetical protein PHAGE_JEFFCO_19 [Acinetobacter phage JeffCo]
MYELGIEPIYPVDLPLPQSNFNGSTNTPTQTTQFTSGRIRRRKIGRTATKKATLEWLFTPEEYDLWEVFFREELNMGCNKFKINMSTGGDSQTGEHVVQCIGDPSFSHSECNWIVSVECVIHPYPVSDSLGLLEGYLGSPVQSFLDVINMYYEEEHQQ